MSVPPLRVAVVGAGPAGFYAAAALLKMAGESVQVDLIERLPTPFGLVRSGIAPDHPSIKRISRAFTRTAKKPNVRFLGNVSLGVDVSVDTLRAHYDAIIYAVGCPLGRMLSLPGATSPGVHTACDFVFWYNGHPDHTHHDFHLQSVRRALVVGVGNVAVDVARILTRDRDSLAETDIADHALAALRASPIEEVIVAGRRGAAQAAFSPKELKELAETPGTDLIVSPEDTVLDDASAAWLPQAPPAARENVALLSELAQRPPGTQPRRIRLQLLTSPHTFHTGPDGRLSSVRLGRNQLVSDGDRIRPVPTGHTWEEPVDLVLFAIGYRGTPIPAVPFDAGRGVIPNQDGLVRPGEYVTGWARRGPTGLIGTNRPDARDVAERVLAECTALGGRPDLRRTLLDRGVRLVSFAQWEALDAEEQRRAGSDRRPRRKMTDIEEMLSFIGV